MSDPSPYTPTYSFAGYQATNPVKPLPAQAVDNELARIQAAIASLVDAVKDVRRSDGKLKNRSVGLDQLETIGILGSSELGAHIDELIAAVEAAAITTTADLAASTTARQDAQAAAAFLQAALNFPYDMGNQADPTSQTYDLGVQGT